MAWEREYHHIDLDTGEHVISLIERSVTTQKGEPARWLIQIKMSGEKFEHIVGKNKLTLHIGNGMEVQPDGTLKAFDGSTFDPRAFELSMIAQLNKHHTNLRAYGRKHGAPDYKGPKAK